MSHLTTVSTWNESSRNCQGTLRLELWRLAMDWNGSLVLITGASRGIGRGIAVAAAKRGARVGLMARSKSELDEVLDACGGKGAAAVSDVAERAQVESAI